MRVSTLQSQHESDLIKRQIGETQPGPCKGVPFHTSLRFLGVMYWAFSGRAGRHHRASEATLGTAG